MIKSLKNVLPQSLFGKTVWFLVITFFFSILYSKAAKADEVNKNIGESRYFLVQNYIGNKALGESEPYKLHCANKKCSLFLGSAQVKKGVRTVTSLADNPWLKKGCTEESLDSTVKGSEISCKFSNVKTRWLEISETDHSRRLVLRMLNKGLDKNGKSWV